MNYVDVWLRTMMRIPWPLIVRVFWSVPHWDKLNRRPHNRGIVRHGVKSPVNYVPENLKPPYHVHVERYLQHVGDPSGRSPRAILAFGARNAGQNLLQPGWSLRHGKSRLLKRPDEPWEVTTYHAFLKYQQASPGPTHRNDPQVAIEPVRFSADSGPRSCELVLLNGPESRGTDCEWAIPGPLVLFDGEIPPHALIAAFCYDLRHAWHLRWEARYGCDADAQAHDALMSVLWRMRRSRLEERAAALAVTATRLGLPVENGFHHSSIGVTPAGDITLVMMQGALTQLGSAHLELGSQRACLLDNGGSVGAAYWSKADWEKDGWETIRHSPTVIGNNTYFRPRGHSVIVIELAEDILEAPFRPRPNALRPWPPTNR